MKNNIKIMILTAIIAIGFGLATNAAVKAVNPANPVNPAKAPAVIQKAAAPSAVYENANSLDIVANPTKYLNKRVKIKAKFDKFSTLGLDYKPAYRSSDKYITFLIKRDDVLNHTVPLSEMKNFLDRDTAEKYIELKSGDDIEYSGVVFSNALGDAWISVEKFVVLNPKAKDAAPAKK